MLAQSKRAGYGCFRRAVCNCFPDRCCYDPLVSVAKIWVHRQANNPFRSSLCMREGALSDSGRGKRGLQMKRNGVMDRRGDTFGFQVLLKLFAAFNFDGVLRVHASIVRLDMRHGYNIFQQFAVGGPNAHASGNFIVERLELGQQHRCLKSVHTPIDSDQRVMVTAVLAVDPDLTHPRG